MNIKVTSQEVARHAGVSQSAVSRVFSGASASKATIAKVHDAANRLGYRPNSLARAMITGKTRIIGLVVSYLENQFYPVALERLSNALQKRGYHILVFMAENEQERVEDVVAELLDYQVDGIITASVSISSNLTQRCAKSGIPVVMFNRAQPRSGHSSVTSANVEGGRKVANFLVKSGHHRIAHIAGWKGSSTGRDRLQGFIDGLKEHGQAPIDIIDGMFNRNIAAQATQILMQRQTKPDAIFVANDHMAFAVLDILRQGLGVRVPQDISVVGYDDVPMASWAAYDLTTVRQPVNRMVDATIDTLLANIQDPECPIQTIEIDGPLIIRGSTRSLKGA